MVDVFINKFFVWSSDFWSEAEKTLTTNSSNDLNHEFYLCFIIVFPLIHMIQCKSSCTVLFYLKKIVYLSITKATLACKVILQNTDFNSTYPWISDMKINSENPWRGGKMQCSPTVFSIINNEHNKSSVILTRWIINLINNMNNKSSILLILYY